MRTVSKFNLRRLFLAVTGVCCAFASLRFYLDRAESQQLFAQWCRDRNANVVYYCEANYLDKSERRPSFIENRFGIDAASSISAIQGLEISSVADAEYLNIRLRSQGSPVLVMADFADDIPLETQKLFVGFDNFDGCIGRLPHKHGEYRPFIRDGQLNSKFPYEERPEYIERMQKGRENE